jgi:hypothetical protein
MQESNYTYRFINPDSGLHYFINNGVLATSGPAKILPNAPDGWQQYMLKWERNKTDWGVIRGFTIPLKFVTDGALILRTLFLEQGYEARCALIINEMNPDDRVLKEIFRGDVDFTTIDSDIDFVQVNIIEGGLYNLLKANESSTFEMKVNVPSAINVKLDGINITGYYRWTITEWLPGGGRPTGALPTMVLIGQEQKAPGISAFDISGGYTFSYGVLNGDSTPYFLSFAIPPGTGTGKFTGKINMASPDPMAPASIFLWRWNTIAGTRSSELLFVGPEAAVINIDKTVTVNEGDRFFLEIDEYHLESELTFTITTRSDTTIIKARKSADILGELTKSITDNKYLSQSDLLTAAYQSEFVLTSLNAILGKPDIAVIKTHLNDFYKFSHTRFSATKYVDDQNRLRIESMEKAFDQTIIFDIGPVKNFGFKGGPDMLFSDMDAGYKTQTYEDVNGKYEFNALQKWKAPGVRVKPKLDLVCPYRADPYGIEIARINLAGKDTTDDSGDNEVFILHVDLSAPEIIDGQTVYPLKRPAYSAVVGVPDNTIYNRECSPKYGILNNGRFLRSLLWKLEPGQLQFKTAEKNGDLSTTLAGVTIKESKSIDIGALGDPYFVPVPMQFEPMSNVDIVTILNVNPRGLIQWQWNDKDYYGFILEINKQPATNSATQWTVLPAPQNILTQLKNG